MLRLIPQQKMIGKSMLKFEMHSYQEKVVNDLRQMSEDNQQLIWLKNRVVKEQRHAKALEQSLGFVTEKLRQTTEENRIVRQRTKTQHEETKEEMYEQEQFFKEQIKIIHDSREEKEENFERLQQEQREKVQHSHVYSSNDRLEEVDNFIKFQNREMEDFDTSSCGEQSCNEAEALGGRGALEKEFDAKLTQLMDKYSKLNPEAASN